MDDAVKVYELNEELIDVKYKSKNLAILLKLPPSTVDAIHEGKCIIRSPFTNVVMQFIRHNPRPTWRIILKALRDPQMSDFVLASKIESQLHSTPTGMNDFYSLPVIAYSVAYN